MRKLSLILAFGALAMGCGTVGGTYEECRSGIIVMEPSPKLSPSTSR